MERETAPVSVLIAEDDHLIAWGLEAILEDAGYRVCGMAEDADQAVALAECKRPDVVLMDIRLARGTDGVSAAIEIRSRLGIPSIFLSANIDAETRLRTTQAHPLMVLGKPYDPRDIISALERCR